MSPLCWSVTSTPQQTQHMTSMVLPMMMTTTVNIHQHQLQFHCLDKSHVPTTSTGLPCSCLCIGHLFSSYLHLYKAAVLGAELGIGQLLSLLLKINSLVNSPSLYDGCGAPGVTADVSHVRYIVCTRVQDFGFELSFMTCRYMVMLTSLNLLSVTLAVMLLPEILIISRCSCALSYYFMLWAHLMIDEAWSMCGQISHRSDVIQSHHFKQEILVYRQGMNPLSFFFLSAEWFLL